MKHTGASCCIFALILAALGIATQPAAFAVLDVSASPFADSEWLHTNEKTGLNSVLSFQANGDWSEATPLHPLKGHWRTTKDDAVVEVRISNGDVDGNKVIHFAMSADGTKCTRAESSVTWDRQSAQKPQIGGALQTGSLQPGALQAGSLLGKTPPPLTPPPISRPQAPSALNMPSAPIVAQSKEAAAVALVAAPWRITAKWWFNIRTFAKDGTFTTQGWEDQGGTWAIADNVVTLTFTKDAHKETLSLPIDPRGTTGLDKNGIPVAAIATPPPGPPAMVDMQATAALLASGPWRIKGGWWATIRNFTKDGGFTTPGNGGETGTWKIANNMVILTFPDGHNDTFNLPLDAKVTYGADRNGAPTVANLQDLVAEKNAKPVPGFGSANPPAPVPVATPRGGSVFGSQHQ